MLRSTDTANATDSKEAGQRLGRVQRIAAVFVSWMCVSVCVSYPVAVHLPRRPHVDVALVIHVARHVRRLPPLVIVHARRRIPPGRVGGVGLEHGRHLQCDVSVGGVVVERVDEEAGPGAEVVEVEALVGPLRSPAQPLAERLGAVGGVGVGRGGREALEDAERARAEWSETVRGGQQGDEEEGEEEKESELGEWRWHDEEGEAQSGAASYMCSVRQLVWNCKTGAGPPQ